LISPPLPGAGKLNQKKEKVKMIIRQALHCFAFPAEKQFKQSRTLTPPKRLPPPQTKQTASLPGKTAFSAQPMLAQTTAQSPVSPVDKLLTYCELLCIMKPSHGGLAVAVWRAAQPARASFWASKSEPWASLIVVLKLAFSILMHKKGKISGKKFPL